MLHEIAEQPGGLPFVPPSNPQEADRTWVEEGERLPQRGTALAASPAQLDELRAHLSGAMTRWEGAEPGQRRAALYLQARRLAGCLFEARTALRSVAARPSVLDPNDEERRRLADLGGLPARRSRLGR